MGECRSRRQPVSLLVLEVSGASRFDVQTAPVLEQVLEMATKSIDARDMLRDAPRPFQRVLVLPGHERQEVVRLAERLIQRIAKMSERLASRGTVLQYSANAGVSSVALPPKNFLPQDLLSSAQRCLSAAQSSGSGSVKSLEAY